MALNTNRVQPLGIVLASVFLGTLFLPRDANAEKPSQPPYRDLVKSIQIRGCQQIPEQIILKRLGNLPEIVEALHPKVDTATFRFRVRDAVERGLLACGFLDRRVTAEVKDDIYVLTVHEGERFRWGGIQVTGASDEANASIVDRLLILETDAKEPKPVWNPGYVASGNPLSQFGIAGQIRRGLSQMGLDAVPAHVKFDRRNDTKTVELVVGLAKSDRLIAAFDPVEEDAETDQGEDKAEQNARQAPRDAAPSELAARLQQIYQSHFATASSGYLLKRVKDNVTNQMGFGRQHIFVDVESEQKQLLAAFVEPDELFVSMGDSENTWNIPGFDFSLYVTINALAESGNGGYMHIGFKGNVSSEDKEPKPMVRGVSFTSEAWEEWFPVDKVQVTEAAGETTISFGDYALHLDADDQVVSIQNGPADGDHLLIERIADDQVIQLGRSVVSVDKANEIFAREADGKKTTLAQVFSQAFGGDEDDKNYEFFIGPSNGEKSVWGVMILNIANGGTVYPKDSLIAKIATIYGLRFSGHMAYYSDRLDEVESELLNGPISALLLADLALGNNDWDRAEKYYSLVPLLANKPDAVRHDLELVFATNGLPGQIVESIDMKEVVRIAVQLSGESTSITSILANGILGMLPDGTDANQRRDNAIRIGQFLFEMRYRESLEQYVASKMQQVAHKKRKIAEKKEKKKKENKSR